MRKPLRIASCQFPVEANISSNLEHILSQIAQASNDGAHIVHFPEAALSGYAGVDIPTSDDIHWAELHEATRHVMQAAHDHHVWVLVGSAHRLTTPNPPHNSVYVINDTGQIVERYDKRFCTGRSLPVRELDLAHYSPGNHATIFELNGYRCGVLICYDYRFPELYRDLRTRDVDIIFQSFHNARRSKLEHDSGNIWESVVPATMICRAATNHFWISATNSSAQYSCWGNFFVYPNGHLPSQLPAHATGILLSDIDPNDTYWDASQPWRERSIHGQLHSGELMEDCRSQDRQQL